jgi:hypothetical protein
LLQSILDIALPTNRKRDLLEAEDDEEDTEDFEGV